MSEAKPSKFRIKCRYASSRKQRLFSTVWTILSLTREYIYLVYSTAKPFAPEIAILGKSSFYRPCAYKGFRKAFILVKIEINALPFECLDIGVVDKNAAEISLNPLQNKALSEIFLNGQKIAISVAQNTLKNTVKIQVNNAINAWIVYGHILTQITFNPPKFDTVGKQTYKQLERMVVRSELSKGI